MEKCFYLKSFGFAFSILEREVLPIPFCLAKFWDFLIVDFPFCSGDTTPPRPAQHAREICG
jgi:hypothetical protein